MYTLFFIIIYVASIFLVRLAYRNAFKYGFWLKSSAEMNILWFIPFVNTCIGIFFHLINFIEIKKIELKKTKNNFPNLFVRFLKWLTNNDLEENNS